MKSVRYLKVVLTVIAACLVLICLRDVSLVRAASTKVDMIPGRYQIIALPTANFVTRVDTLTGQLCTFKAWDLVKCSPQGE